MGLRFYRWLVILRYILRIRFPFFTLQKLTLSGWYLWLYSLTARQTLYKCAFYSLSYESLWIQLRSILLPVLYAACLVSLVFSYQNKETPGTLISQTNPQGTNELYQLSVRANECGYMFVIDCSLASDRDQNVRVRISPRLTLKNDPPFKVCNKLFLRKVNHCFSSAKPFGCSNLEINIRRKEQRKERLANICPFNEASMLQQLCLIPIWRKRTGSTDSTLNLLVPVNMFLSPSSSQIINKWTALESNWLRQVRKKHRG